MSYFKLSQLPLFFALRCRKQASIEITLKIWELNNLNLKIGLFLLTNQMLRHSEIHFFNLTFHLMIISFEMEKEPLSYVLHMANTQKSSCHE